uniref:Uncharacterized protein n=1 Tax=Arundo donax TaxID=35708 RepID=A0A0A8ZIQ4_ARUDO
MIFVCSTLQYINLSNYCGFFGFVYQYRLSIWAELASPVDCTFFCNKQVEKQKGGAIYIRDSECMKL